MSWRAAESITVLRKQLNALFPNRSKASDGIVGDLAHKKSKSDHNPNRLGVVRAFDITHDPANGVDCNYLAAVLQSQRDSRIKYLIWNRRILSSTKEAWKWRKYSGRNGHTKHLHISVNEHNYDSKHAWVISDNVKPAHHHDPELVEFGDRGFAVSRFQTILANLGFLAASDIDGIFGNDTFGAVQAFQTANGLDSDGIVGPKTLVFLNNVNALTPALEPTPPPDIPPKPATIPSEKSNEPKTAEPVPSTSWFNTFWRW